ncbi:MAG: hypothetical protein Q7R56_03325 [Nanoarchaeota archaeon]|nr:hypothetical protein [Nanoarchaeota archaeon]
MKYPDDFRLLPMIENLVELARLECLSKQYDLSLSEMIKIIRSAVGRETQQEEPIKFTNKDIENAYDYIAKHTQQFREITTLPNKKRPIVTAGIILERYLMQQGLLEPRKRRVLCALPEVTINETKVFEMAVITRLDRAYLLSGIVGPKVRDVGYAIGIAKNGPTLLSYTPRVYLMPSGLQALDDDIRLCPLEELIDYQPLEPNGLSLQRNVIQ